MDYYKLDKGTERKMVMGKVSDIEEGQLNDNESLEQDVVLLQNSGDTLSPDTAENVENVEEQQTVGSEAKNDKNKKKGAKPKVVLLKLTLAHDKEQKALQKIVELDPLGLSDDDY